MAKSVKVARVPGRVVEVAVDDDANVSACLAAADIDMDGCTVTINGNDVLDTVIPTDGATILVANESVKGNVDKIVKVARVPGRVVEVAISDNAPVSDALAEADIDPEGCTITIDGREVSLDTVVNGGQTILVANESVKGNG